MPHNRTPDKATAIAVRHATDELVDLPTASNCKGRGMANIDCRLPPQDAESSRQKTMLAATEMIAGQRPC